MTMVIFTAKNKLADVILKDKNLIPIISRFGIKLGFGNMTVEEVCEQHQVDTTFFLEIINSYHHTNYFPSNHLIDFSANMMIRYLSNTHRYYLNVKLPQIEKGISQMENEASAENSRNIGLLRQFFLEYKREVEGHFKKEEEAIFPYILLLEEAIRENHCPTVLIDRVECEPIEIYERHHDNLEEKLSDMKNLIIRFLPPVVNQELCELLLLELFRMESDLEDHTKIEEKVLIPKVKLMERKVLEYAN